MNVLIACEESQRVCIAFRNRGHNAFSCDIKECSGGKPEWHIKGDALILLDCPCTFNTCDGKTHTIEKWDLLIAHPPCTYLSNAGVQYLCSNGIINPYRYEKALEAKKFFLSFLNANVDKICVENPLPISFLNLPEYTQIIHPCYFGSLYKKRTCLWLKNLYPLKRTCFDIDGIPCSKAEWYNNCADKHTERSKTFIEVANAMAEQWG